MKRTSLMLPPELQARAFRYARDLGISFGELVRDALEATLERARPGGGLKDPLFEDRAVHRGPSPADLSEAHDRYLYERG